MDNDSPLTDDPVPATERLTLRRIVEDHDTPAGLAFDLVIQALILISLVDFTIGTLPDLSERTQWWLNAIEAGIVAVFTVEYLLRIWVAEKKWRFVFSFFGIVDLLAILPFFLAWEFDLRVFRSFRLLRLFQILKLARYNKATRRFHRAIYLAKEEILLFLIMAGLLIYLSAVGIYYFEHQAQPEKFTSVFHSLWWAVVTLTTVGYGDIYPVTVGGRVFTFVVLLVGLGVVSVPAGIVAAALGRARDLEE